jgi:putative sterol carrier protein
MADASSHVSSLAQWLDKVPSTISSQQLKHTNAVIQLRSTGAEPGERVLVIKEGTCTVEEGKAKTAPNLTVEATSETWLALMNKQLDPTWAYMSGKLHVSGDLDLAMRLQSILAF